MVVQYGLLKCTKNAVTSKKWAESNPNNCMHILFGGAYAVTIEIWLRFESCNSAYCGAAQYVYV